MKQNRKKYIVPAVICLALVIGSSKLITKNSPQPEENKISKKMIQNTILSAGPGGVSAVIFPSAACPIVITAETIYIISQLRKKQMRPKGKGKKEKSFFYKFFRKTSENQDNTFLYKYRYPTYTTTRR